MKAVELGADALGFNFYPPSPRYISPEGVRAILAELPTHVCRVAVFVNEPRVKVQNILSFACGPVDAALFIVALLELTLLRELLDQARALSLDALVEVHTEEELECSVKAGARLIGINNRNLRTFEVRLETTERLVPLVPPGIVVVCESGIDRPEQIGRLEDLGVHIFLVGEALMRARDPGAKLRELLTVNSEKGKVKSEK